MTFREPLVATHLAWFVALLSCSCGVETEGKTVQVTWQLDQAAEVDHASFETEAGFHVELEEARVGLAAVYGYGPKPNSTKAVALLRSLNPVSVAYAHGGLDPETGRRVLVELLDPIAVDLLDEQARTLHPIEAEAGDLDAVKFELVPGGAEGLDDLHGGSMYLRGRAERNDRSVRFTAVVKLDSAIKSRSVDLLGSKGDLDEGSVVHVEIDPSVWFRNAALDRLLATEPDDVLEIAADSQVGRALAIGVRSPEAFRVRLTSKGKGSP